MVYACDNCHFLFFRVSHTERCPNCGKENIRPADSDEILRFEAAAAPERKDSK